MEKANELCKKLRIEAGLSREELASAMNVSVNTVLLVEKGERGLGSKVALKYADLFGEEYLDDLAGDLVRYDSGPKIKELLDERHIKANRFAKAFGVPCQSLYKTLNGFTYANGNPHHGFDDEEIKQLALYFHVDPKVFKVGKYYVRNKEAGSKKRWIPGIKTVDDPRPKEVKKTAQMICEEEKKMEYEEALKKAKEYDSLNAKYYNECIINASLTEELNAAVDELARVNKALNELKEAKPITVEVAPVDYQDLTAERDKYKDILFKLLLERYEKE